MALGWGFLVAGCVAGIFAGDKFVFWSGLSVTLGAACVLLHRKNYRRILKELRDPRVVLAWAAITLGCFAAFRVGARYFFGGWLLAIFGVVYLETRRNRVETLPPPR